MTILRTNGTEEVVSFEAKKGDFVLDRVYKLINCDCVNMVRLPHREQVMLVDDNGLAKELPFNEKATRLYHSVCRPGTTSPIVGDVVLLDQEDFT